MKVSNTLALLSTIALAAAQVHFDTKTNQFSCTQTNGLAAYCAGGDIIIRCSGGVGTPGNCNDNLAGEAPVGNTGLAGCYQSSRSAGDAACTKAGLVYPSSGSGASNITTPYPIPGTVEGTKPSNSTGAKIPLVTGTGISMPLTTEMASNANGAGNGGRWSNVTTVTVQPVPAYTAGSGATTFVQSANPVATAPMAFTGAAAPATSSSSHSPYWAFAVFALVAVF